MSSLFEKIFNSLFAPATLYGPTADQKEITGPLLTYPSRETKQWYVIMLWGNAPDQAKDELERRVKETGLESYILSVIAPQELNPDPSIKESNPHDIEYIYDMLETNPIPGFLLVEMEMTDETRHLILGVRQVKRFVTEGELSSFLEAFGVSPFSLIPEK